MLLPWGHENGPLDRRPWVTLALITACVVIVVLTQFDPAVKQFGRRMDAAHSYWSAHPYLEPGDLLADYFGDAGAEARRDFQAALAAGEVPIPKHAVEAEQAKLEELTGEAEAALERHVWHRYGLIPSAPRVEGVFGHLFLHGGWAHLIGNLIFLLLTAPFLENRWGRVSFLLFYAGAGVAAALTYTIQHPYLTGPLIGASGAIAGAMGAFLVIFATVRIKFAYWLGLFWGTFAVPAWLLLPLWFGHELATARLMDVSGTSDGVAYWAHVGGFAFGAVVAALLKVSGIDARLAAESVPVNAKKKPVSEAPGQSTPSEDTWEAPEPEAVGSTLPGLLWAAVSKGHRAEALDAWQALREAKASFDGGSPDATLRLAGWLAARGDAASASLLLGDLLPRATDDVAARIARVAGRIDPDLARRAAEAVANNESSEPGGSQVQGSSILKAPGSTPPDLEPLDADLDPTAIPFEPDLAGPDVPDLAGPEEAPVSAPMDLAGESSPDFGEVGADLSEGDPDAFLMELSNSAPADAIDGPTATDLGGGFDDLSDEEAEGGLADFDLEGLEDELGAVSASEISQTDPMLPSDDVDPNEATQFDPGPLDLLDSAAAPAATRAAPASPASLPAMGAAEPLGTAADLFETDEVDLTKDDEAWSFDDGAIGLDEPGSHAASGEEDLFEVDAIDLGSDDTD